MFDFFFLVTCFDEKKELKCIRYWF